MVLRRIRRCVRLGRFDSLEHPADHAHQLQRLSLVYARNGAGKSTLARLLAAAGDGNAAEILLDRQIGAADPPEVVLELDAAQYLRFDGSKWVGVSPRVVVFDRGFVEANVYEGRRQSKTQRKELLALALGPEHVAVQRDIKILVDRSRKVADERKPHHAVIATAAAGFSLKIDEFLALPPQVDPDSARREVQARLDEAIRADEIRKRPRPAPFLRPPELDMGGLRSLLGTDARSIGEDTKSALESHLAELGDRGEAWVRYGLGVQKGSACPFCAQDVAGVTLIDLYRRRFDEAYRRLVDDLGAQLESVAAIAPWWEKVRTVGAANVTAFGRWSDVEGVVRPDFGSREREKDVEHISKVATAALTHKRNRPLAPLPSAVDLGALESRYQALQRGVKGYNGAVSATNARVDAHLKNLASQDPGKLRQELRRIDAAVRRHAEDVVDAVSKRAGLDAERIRIEADKEAAAARLEGVQKSRLPTFAERVNDLLADLCAEFSIAALDSERVGGEAGMEYTLVVRAGSTPIRSGSEEPFARVLSDGDRSTIALAVFLSSLDDVPNLGQALVVFDDPIASLDVARQIGTAEQIVKLASRAGQVLVLSHHAPFVSLVALDWARHVGPSAKGDIVDLELEHGRSRLRLRKQEESEHLRLVRELQEFVDKRHDDDAEHYQGEIRKLLESDARHRWPDIYSDNMSSLEKVIGTLKANAELRRKAVLSDTDLEEFDWLCAFGARGNHAQGHLPIEPPDPAAVRRMAQRALTWVAR